jgi:hypothetical protein
MRNKGDETGALFKLVVQMIGCLNGAGVAILPEW